MKILQINASARAEGANSTRLADAITTRLTAIRPDAVVEKLDLALAPHPVLDAPAIGALFTAANERTPEQDPMFVFRILVDVACKALSPAVNDPTTAVLAIDQVHHLLRRVGLRRLDTGEVRDSGGQLRLLYRTPDWEDFVLLGVAEIRQYGVTSIQVARRLNAIGRRDNHRSDSAYPTGTA